MGRHDNRPYYDEEKEKKAIKWENDVLFYLMPSVGLTAFILGLVGFILTIAVNPGIGVFLLILALLGLGGIAYGVVQFLKRRANRPRKEKLDTRASNE